MSTTKIKCDRCGAKNRPLFRVNEKGVPGVWTCGACLRPRDDPEPDPVVKGIANLIGGVSAP